MLVEGGGVPELLHVAHQWVCGDKSRRQLLPVLLVVGPPRRGEVLVPVAGQPKNKVKNGTRAREEKKNKQTGKAGDTQAKKAAAEG